MEKKNSPMQSSHLKNKQELLLYHFETLSVQL